MKPFKTLFMLLTAVILLTATSACEEEWSNLSDDQKLIELLLQPTPGAEDFNLDPNHRFVILKTGLDPDSISKDPYLQAQTQFQIHYWTMIGDSIELPSDTVSFFIDISTLRQNLTVTPDKKVWLNDFEVVGIEDATSRVHPHSGLHYHFLAISTTLYSKEDLPDFVRFIETLGCQYKGSIYFEEHDYFPVWFHLPLGRKAIPTAEYIRTNCRVKECGITEIPAICLE